MITREQTQFLELLRSGLWGNEIDQSLFEGDINWQAILDLARQQTVLGIISPQIEYLPAEKRPSFQTALKLHQLLTNNRQQFEKHIQIIGKVYQILQAHGVQHPVILKGIGVSMNYPDPTARQCGDIDIYVGEKHFDQACDALRDYADFEGALDSIMHYDCEIEGVSIEIHRFASRKEWITKNAKHFDEWCRKELEEKELRTLTYEGVTCYTPPPSFDAFYIFLHLWRHFCNGGIGLRQLCDWVCYLDKQHQNIDKKALCQTIDFFGLTPIWSKFAGIACEDLGLNQTYYPIPEKLTKAEDRSLFLQHIFNGGNFGNYFNLKAVKRSKFRPIEIMQSIHYYWKYYKLLKKIDPNVASLYWKSTLYCAFQIRIYRLLGITRK